jgi:hypothetical protein
MYRDIMTVEHKIYDFTGNNWIHRNSNERCKEKFGNRTKKTFSRFTTNVCNAWNITHKAASTAV